ncbi:MAG TPA: hypothetical protein PKC96_02465 [Bacilli bacterium]|nr:hypothetical protein [Bacilli bacterium]
MIISRRDRVFIAFNLFFWGLVGFFFTGWYLFALLPLFGVVFIFLKGGKKHV